MTQGKKRILLLLGAIVGVVVIAVLSLPVWLPWILRPISSKFGAEFERYTRIGYGRFALHNASFTNETIRFHAGRIESALPSALVWNRSRGGSELLINDWTLHVLPKEQKAPGTNTPVGIVANIQSTVDRFNDWINRAALSDGVVTFQQYTAAVPGLVWKPPHATARLVVTVPPVGKVPVDLSLHFGNGSNIDAEIRAPSLDFVSNLKMERDNKELSVHATNHWGTNRFLASARFRDDMLPDTAKLSARAFHLPATNLPVSDYQGVDTSVTAVWTNGSFALQLAFNVPSQETNLPSLSGTLIAHGDTNAATVRELRIEGAGGRAELSRPVQFSYRSELLSGPARLSVTGDLARLPLPDLGGTFGGHVDVKPSASKYPDIDAALTLGNVRAHDISVARTEAAVELRWPVIRLPALTATLESGARVELAGELNVTNREILGARLRFEGQLPTNLVPSLQYSNLVVTAEASGPLTNIAHQMTASASAVQVGALQPIDLQLVEHGEQFQIANLRAIATSRDAAIKLTASGEWSPDTTTGRISTLTYWRGATNTPPLYRLVDSVDVRFTPGSNAPPVIETTPLVLQGDGRHVSVQVRAAWPEAGSSRISIEGLRSTDFTNLLATSLPAEFSVSKLDAAMQWSNGPVRMVFDATARVITTAAPPVQLTFRGTNTSDTIHINALSIAESDRLVVTGEARFPLSAMPSSDGLALLVHSNSPMRVELHTTTNKAITALLEQFANVMVTDPSLQVSLAGTPAEPRGTARISAAAVESATLTNRSLPPVQDIAGHVTFDANAVRLPEVRATVAGQAIRATAEVPVAESGPLSSRLQLDKASADLRVPSADLAALAPYATNFLAPRGRLDVALALRPGRQLSGHITITNAATATFPSIGPVHDIDASVRLRDSAAIIESISARAGGAPMLITGRVDFASWEPGTNRWPGINIRLRGTNVAIVREAQKIIRTDLDLQITNTAQSTPGIGGTVNLRDSLYLANLAELVPRGVRKPSQRPPYFSVDAELLRDWPLNVHVHGERFLNVRSPIFRGEVSANLDVRGRLGEPLAVGEVRINSGRLSFPFATLSIKQGFVTLGSANPYAPELFVTAAGRAYDYDIRLEVTGRAQEPVLEFTSTPSLTSEQILLMVSSGQMPRSDFTLSTDQRAQKLGMFVGKNLLSELGFGGGDSLTIRSGEDISERGRSTYSVEYKLTEDVSLVGEYDRFDEYNAGVQWRVFSK